MPVPDKYKKKYGLIVWHMINQGISPATARKKTDKAIKDIAKKDKAKDRKKKSG